MGAVLGSLLLLVGAVLLWQRRRKGHPKGKHITVEQHVEDAWVDPLAKGEEGEKGKDEKQGRKGEEGVAVRTLRLRRRDTVAGGRRRPQRRLRGSVVTHVPSGGEEESTAETVNQDSAAARRHHSAGGRGDTETRPSASLGSLPHHSGGRRRRRNREENISHGSVTLRRRRSHRHRSPSSSVIVSAAAPVSLRLSESKDSNPAVIHSPASVVVAGDGQVELQALELIRKALQREKGAATVELVRQGRCVCVGISNVLVCWCSDRVCTSTCMSLDVALYKIVRLAMCVCAGGAP